MILGVFGGAESISAIKSYGLLVKKSKFWDLEEFRIKNFSRSQNLDFLINKPYDFIPEIDSAPPKTPRIICNMSYFDLKLVFIRLN